MLRHQHTSQHRLGARSPLVLLSLDNSTQPPGSGSIASLPLKGASEPEPQRQKFVGVTFVTTVFSLQVPDKIVFRACKRKSLRGGAFARRKFSVNSVRSPRKLSGTIHMGQIYSRSRGGGPGHGRRGGGPGHAFARRGRATDTGTGGSAAAAGSASPSTHPTHSSSSSATKNGSPLL